MVIKILFGPSKKDPARILGAAILWVIVIQVIRFLEAIVTMDYYLDPNYFAVWSKLMMPGPGPPPMEFLYTSIGFNFIMGLIFALVYTWVAVSFSGSTVKKGISFGWLLFLVLTIPTLLSLVLLINLPLGLIITWAITGFIINMIGGVGTAKIIG